MKIPLLDLTGQKAKEISLPDQFSESYHPDLIGRAVLALQSNSRQAYGIKQDAGNRASARVSRRRRNYRGSYGHGISRVPRKVLWRRGTQFGWVGAIVSGTVGGRTSHPPKSEKIWSQKINIKERRKAIRSALAATLNKELVQARNHILPKDYPFILESKIEAVSKTKELKNILISLGLKEELNRCKTNNSLGPLIVIANPKSSLLKVKGLQGVDAVVINNINAELLAPGARAGRLTLYTEGAIEELAKKGLFRK